MACFQENGQSGMLTVSQHPCSYPGPKGSEIISSSQFSTSEEKILPDQAVNTQSPSRGPHTTASFAWALKSQQCSLKIGGSSRSLSLCETNYTSTPDSRLSTFLNISNICLRLYVHFPIQNL